MIDEQQVKEFLKTLTLLYVEDEEDITVQFSRYLSRFCGKLVTASNGQEGLATYREHHPDIILTDIRMPVMDGLAMAEQIRDQDATVPIIILSAFDQADYLMRSIDIGVDRYVTKPVETQQLQKALLACARRLLVDRQLRQTRESLQIERQRLETIIEGTRIGTWHWNVQSGEIICNRRWAEMLGLGENEAANISFSYLEGILHPDDSTRNADLLQRHFHGESEAYECDARMRHADGRWLWVMIKGKVDTRDEKGKPLWMSGITLDLTARKNLEIELHESERRFRNLFETTVDPILILDTAQIIDCNPSAVRMFCARNAKALLGWHFCDLSPERQKNGEPSLIAARRLIQLALTEGEQHFEWLQYRLDDGTEFITDVRLTPIDFNGRRVLSASLRDITDRKRAEEALRRSRERFALAVEGSNDGIWDWSLPDNSVYFSPRWKEQLGYHDEELENVYSTFERLLHPEDLEPTQTAINDYLQGRIKRYAIEFRMRHKDGSWRWIRARGTAVRDTLGVVVRMAGSHTDITEHRLREDNLVTAHRKLATANQVLHSIVESMSDWLWEVDEEWRYTYCSPQIERHLGFSVEEIIGKNPADFFAQEEREKTAAMLARAVRRGERIKDLVSACLDKAGQRVLVSTNAVPIIGKDGRVSGYRGISRDITEQRRIVAELRISEERHRLLAEYAGDSIWTAGLDGKFHYVSPSSEKIRGYTPEESQGQTPADVLTPESQVLVLDFLERSRARVAAGQPMEKFQKELEQRCKDGSTVWTEVTAGPLYASDGSFIEIVGVTRNISERRRYQRELEVARDAAETANKAKSRFLANMSHEIRTPMNSIMGMAQLLQQTALDEEQHEYMEAIRLSSHNLLSLINDILDLSRIESGRIELEQAPFTLRSCVRDVVTSQQALVNDKGLEMFVDIPEDIPDALVGDQLRLKQVLLNLLNNAIKFTPAGSIKLTVSKTDGTPEGALLTFAVTDTGIGIGEAALEDIFKPFVQADSTTTRKFGGTGLGLTISSRLAGLMGGQLRAESREGEGSTFSVELPFALANEPALSLPPATARNARWQGPPLKILLVDDQETNRLLTRSILERSGHTVDEANDGREALDRWRTDRYDLILMDIQMPVMNGLEAVARIRGEEKGRDVHVAIVALTAHAFAEERENILASGFDGYVSKPIDMGLFFQAMADCLPRQGQTTLPEVAPPPVTASPAEAASGELPPGETATTMTATEGQQLATLLDDIATLLGNRNLGVIDRFNELRRLVPHSAPVERLGRHLKKFDFDGALSTLVDIERSLAHTHNGGS